MLSLRWLSFIESHGRFSPDKLRPSSRPASNNTWSFERRRGMEAGVGRAIGPSEGTPSARVVPPRIGTAPPMLSDVRNCSGTDDADEWKAESSSEKSVMVLSLGDGPPMKVISQGNALGWLSLDILHANEWCDGTGKPPNIPRLEKKLVHVGGLFQ
ncbi:uncharacterized protein BJX67DRAFT_246364 [Aspergillus lucknowensis]|uniref:Uncharacterized protein n=1 Tax=Aspergillus lucknowensis TaxID=176173 RepID=A0ABR4M1P9_9EURO